jgi:large exoprotein involved in heme utilization and adhesion
LASGRSGSIRIDADRVEILGQGLVTTASLAAGEDAGEAGGIVVMARDALRLSGGGSVSAETARADAGDIEIRVGRLLDIEDGAITTSAAGGRGAGGDILIDPEFVVLDNSRIVANAREGAGGNIRIVADNFIATPDSVISASSDLGIDGTVVVEASEQDVTGGLVALPVGFVDASALLPASCAARRSAHLSSFTATGRGGLPPGPDTPLPGFYTLGLGAFGAPPAAAAPAWGALAGSGSVRTTDPLMPRVPCGATDGRSTG